MFFPARRNSPNWIKGRLGAPRARKMIAHGFNRRWREEGPGTRHREPGGRNKCSPGRKPWVCVQSMNPSPFRDGTRSDAWLQVPPAEAGSGFIKPAYPGLNHPNSRKGGASWGPRLGPGLSLCRPAGWHPARMNICHSHAAFSISVLLDYCNPPVILSVGGASLRHRSRRTPMLRTIFPVPLHQREARQKPGCESWESVVMNRESPGDGTGCDFAFAGRPTPGATRQGCGTRQVRMCLVRGTRQLFAVRPRALAS